MGLTKIVIYGKLLTLVLNINGGGKMKKLGNLMILIGCLVILGAMGYLESEPTATISGTLLKVAAGFLLVGTGTRLVKKQ